MDLGRPQTEGNRVDPFSWPLDTFTQTIPGVDKVIYVIVLATIFGEGFFLEYIMCFTLLDSMPKRYVFARWRDANPDLCKDVTQTKFLFWTSCEMCFWSNYNMLFIVYANVDNGWFVRVMQMALYQDLKLK